MNTPRTLPTGAVVNALPAACGWGVVGWARHRLKTRWRPLELRGGRHAGEWKRPLKRLPAQPRTGSPAALALARIYFPQ